MNYPGRLHRLGDCPALRNHCVPIARLVRSSVSGLLRSFLRAPTGRLCLTYIFIYLGNLTQGSHEYVTLSSQVQQM